MVLIWEHWIQAYVDVNDLNMHLPLHNQGV